MLDGALACRVLLSNGEHALIDAEDAPLVLPYCWQESKGYAKARTRQIKMHRVILGAAAGEHVDHVNGIPLDNRRRNLRIATRSENLQNRHGAYGCTGQRNVYRYEDRGYRVQLVADGKVHHRGCFRTLDAAVEAARKARAELMPFSAEAAAEQAP